MSELQVSPRGVREVLRGRRRAAVLDVVRLLRGPEVRRQGVGRPRQPQLTRGRLPQALRQIRRRRRRTIRGREESLQVS